MGEKTPRDGMVPVEEFARWNNLAPAEVVKRIKEGTYEGSSFEYKWYVHPSGEAPQQSHDLGESVDHYSSDYGLTRSLSMFLAFLGWLICVGGVVVAFIGVFAGSARFSGGGLSFVAVLPGVGLAISGLFLVAAAQVARAAVDNADHTREILKILRTKIE